MHAIKAIDPGFAGFGEAYFSTVDMNAVKGWKRHNRMTLNLVVPTGLVEFVTHDERIDGPEAANRFLLGTGPGGDYARLTVPPGIWMAFAGRTEGLNIVLNVASIGHDPDEADRAATDAFPFDIG